MYRYAFRCMPVRAYYIEKDIEARVDRKIHVKEVVPRFVDKEA